jgi:hypothetical protein
MEILVRNRAEVVAIDGIKVAFVTAELPSKPRWTEFSIYLTTHGEWVLQGVGRTRVPGETDRWWSIISTDPIDVIESIIGNDASRLAKKLLAQSLLALVADRQLT